MLPKPSRPILKMPHLEGSRQPPHEHSRRVQLNLPPPSSRHHSVDQAPPKPPRLRPRGVNVESSVMMSISSINRNMSVMESVLGKSVVPRRLRKGKKRGHRILCLDGGGVKVS